MSIEETQMRIEERQMCIEERQWILLKGIRLELKSRNHTERNDLFPFIPCDK